MEDIIAIEYDVTPTIANMLAMAQELQETRQRAEAAESALRLATHSTGSTTVLMTLDKYQELLAAVQRAEAAEAKLALVDAYGQYMRNAPKPRTFAEWLEWRESVRA